MAFHEDPKPLFRQTARGLPTSLSIKYGDRKSVWNCYANAKLHLTDANDDLTYIAHLPRGMHGDVVLYDGVDTTQTEAARGVNHKWRSRYDMYVPSPAGQTDVTTPETLYVSGTFQTKWWFVAQIGDEVERFEWRLAVGSRIKDLGQTRWGRELVRMGSDAGSKRSERTQALDNTKTYSKDGKEVVAIFAYGKCWKSLSNIGELRFCGSATTELFDKRWQHLALLSTLCVWQKDQRDAFSASLTVAATA